jgi:lysine 6-dehydrogenase
MRLLVIGAGRMGRAAAWDLGRHPGVELVRLADRDPRVLAEAEQQITRTLRSASSSGARARVQTVEVDLDSEQRLEQLLDGHDAALCSVDYRYNEALTRAAIEARVHLCDLGGNPSVVRRQLALDEAARRKGVTIIPDCGLAPGMACLFAAWGVARFDEPEAVAIRVGGLPAHPNPPLGYKLVFSVRGLTNEYLEPAEVLRNGRVERVSSLTEPESIDFPPPFGTLEAFHTSGGASTLPHTLQNRVKHLDYKTIRYPGHRLAFEAMREIGLFSEQPIFGVVPRAFTESLLERALTDTDTDVVLMRVSVTGRIAGRVRRVVFELTDRQDPRTGHSAMARTTAYPAAAVTYMLGAGAVERRGVVPGELAVPLDAFAAAVRARGIDVVERWED